ncbi:hypothetical protein ACVGOW_26885 [Pseudonocardia saturnea]
MVELVLLGIALLLVLAVVIRALDAAGAPRWRAVAAERRAEWERSRLLRV